jgi:hypothetical protein
MKPHVLTTIRAAEKAVQRLVTACRKDGPVYAQNARAAAQISRTGKWLLNATAALQQGITPPSTVDGLATT